MENRKKELKKTNDCVRVDCVAHQDVSAGQEVKGLLCVRQYLDSSGL